MKKELIYLFKKLGFEPIVIDNNANITSVKEAVAYGQLREMIDSSEAVYNSIEDFTKMTTTDIFNCCSVLSNLNTINADDIKLLTSKDLRRFRRFADFARRALNDSAINNLNKINDAVINKKAEEKKKDTDNLEDLSKEELITRLREKMN